MKPEDLLKDIAIDFDKTIAQNSPHPNYDILEPIEGTKEALNTLKSDNWRIIVYTARSWHFYDIICDYMKKYKLPYDQVVCGKVFAKYYIDDRAIHFNNWKDVLKKVV